MVLRLDLPRPIVLPVVGEGFAGMPVKVDRPKVDKVKAACDRPFFDRFQFFAGHFGEGGEKLGEFDVYCPERSPKSPLLKGTSDPVPPLSTEAFPVPPFEGG